MNQCVQETDNTFFKKMKTAIVLDNRQLTSSSLFFPNLLDIISYLVRFLNRIDRMKTPHGDLLKHR